MKTCTTPASLRYKEKTHFLVAQRSSEGTVWSSFILRFTLLASHYARDKSMKILEQYFQDTFKTWDLCIEKVNTARGEELFLFAPLGNKEGIANGIWRALQKKEDASLADILAVSPADLRKLPTEPVSLKPASPQPRVPTRTKPKKEDAWKEGGDLKTPLEEVTFNPAASHLSSKEIEDAYLFEQITYQEAVQLFKKHRHKIPSNILSLKNT